MKLFGWGKPGRFVSQDAFERSLENELAMTPNTLAELARHGMAPKAELPVEYFFYSNNRERAESLAKEAVPDPTHFLTASGAGVLLLALALLFDALELRQALQCWGAVVGLVGVTQRIVAGLTLRRLSRSLTTRLPHEQYS